MARQKMTQAELGDRIGMKQSTLSRRLNGDINFTLEELARIADALGVRPEHFIHPFEPVTA